MKILDENKSVLAEIIKSEEIESERNFYTEESQEFQFASFNLKKDTLIKRHIHNTQERTITTTSEVIVVIEGRVEIKIYDLKQSLVHTCILKSGDTIALFSGGHGLRSVESAKFIEVKQGPYNPKTDKTLF